MKSLVLGIHSIGKFNKYENFNLVAEVAFRISSKNPGELCSICLKTYFLISNSYFVFKETATKLIIYARSNMLRCAIRPQELKKFSIKVCHILQHPTRYQYEMLTQYGMNDMSECRYL